MRPYNKHGLTNNKTYHSWQRLMIGVRKEQFEVDSRWYDFAKFIKDLGFKPENYILIRRDIREAYSKENCFWGTKAERGGRTPIGKYMQAYRAKRGLCGSSVRSLKSN